MMETSLDDLMKSVGVLETVNPDLYREIKELTWMKETLEEVEYVVDEYDHRANVNVPDEYVVYVIAGILLREIKKEEGWVASMLQKNSGRADISLSESCDVWYAVRNARCLAEGLLEAYVNLKEMVTK